MIHRKGNLAEIYWKFVKKMGQKSRKNSQKIPINQDIWENWGQSQTNAEIISTVI